MVRYPCCLCSYQSHDSFGRLPDTSAMANMLSGGYQSHDSFGCLHDTSAMANMLPGVVVVGSHGTPPSLFAQGPSAASTTTGTTQRRVVIAWLTPGPGAAGDGEPPLVASRTRAPPSPLVATSHDDLVGEEGGCHGSPWSEKPSRVVSSRCSGRGCVGGRYLTGVVGHALSRCHMLLLCSRTESWSFERLMVEGVHESKAVNCAPPPTPTLVGKLSSRADGAPSTSCLRSNEVFRPNTSIARY